MFQIIIDSYEVDEDLARIDTNGMHLDHVYVDHIFDHCEAVITVITTTWDAAADLCRVFGLDKSEIEETD